MSYKIKRDIAHLNVCVDVHKFMCLSTCVLENTIIMHVRSHLSHEHLCLCVCVCVRVYIYTKTEIVATLS